VCVCASLVVIQARVNNVVGSNEFSASVVGSGAWALLESLTDGTAARRDRQPDGPK